MNDELYWLWLYGKLGAAGRKLPQLLARFGTAYDVYRAESEELTGIDSSGNEALAFLEDKNLDSAYSTADYCRRSGIHILPYGTKGYPERLKRLIDPPVLLFCRGKIPDIDSRLTVGIVGTRKMSEYGRNAAYKIAYELAAAGVVTVSGMALGVDAMSEAGTIAANGSLVAVLGCGVNVPYPHEHRRLLEKIIECGSVISEYPPNAAPTRFTFPARNRIISGICQGTLIVEADRTSGAMITAKSAIAQGRDIFALPGNIDEQGSQGTNSLIRDGAVPVLCASDIVEYYADLYGRSLDITLLGRAKKQSDYDPQVAARLGIPDTSHPSPRRQGGAENEKPLPLPKEKAPAVRPLAAPREDNSKAALESLDAATRKIFDLIPLNTAVSADVIMMSGATLGEIMTAVTLLEIKGLINVMPGGLYMRK